MWSGAPHSGGGRGNRAKVVAITSATAVVAVGVSGVLLLGGGKDDNADGVGGNTKAPASPSQRATASAPASADPPGNRTERPTVPGWKVVVNPEWGTAFDVPSDWEVRSPGLLIGFEDTEVDYSDPENWGRSVVVMSAPAVLKDDWCLSDDDKDGRVGTTSLAAVGTKGAKGAKNTGDAALSQAALWVYAGYTQPDTKSIRRDGAARPYTTKSGVKGSIAWARSRNTPVKGKCASDGKAITFGFKNSAGGLVAWCHWSPGTPGGSRSPSGWWSGCTGTTPVCRPWTVSTRPVGSSTSGGCCPSSTASTNCPHTAAPRSSTRSTTASAAPGTPYWCRVRPSTSASTRRAGVCGTPR